MKRILLPVAAVAIAILAAKLYAQEGATSKITGGASKITMVAPDWHYRWHDGRWWYWMSENHENRWMVWSGSTWIPYEQSASRGNVLNASQARPYTTGYGGSETESASRISQPVFSGGSSCPPSGSAGSGGNYAGYGWSWGPGTAYRDAPGRRF
jgi:hypothetical protein